jgi:hypothetical protein
MRSLESFGDATAGPTPSATALPTFMSVGDSLMWGQGLKPEHRFREIVRLRLKRHFGEVVELSMARSGAIVHPERNHPAGTDDARIHQTVLVPPIDENYSPSGYTRETPNSTLSSRQQLRTASELIEAGPCRGVRWILLDGGINDIGINGLLLPLEAYGSGWALNGWGAWIDEQAEKVAGELEVVIEEALELFPNAVVIVNGYFPIFSWSSIGGRGKLNSMGVLYAGIGALLGSGVGLAALSGASYAWQMASNHFIRRAVDRVADRRGRTVLFARSNIETDRCLFARKSWLWGADNLPDGFPLDPAEWVNLLGGATPEDEVSKHRIPRCTALKNDLGERVRCNLASMGHPNVAGAEDYAESITVALENAGIIPSDLGHCDLDKRRRDETCVRFNDDWGYRCVDTEAQMGAWCDDAVKSVASTAQDTFDSAGTFFTEAASALTAGLDPNSFTGRQAGEAIDSFASAGEHAQSIDDCWDSAKAAFEQCQDNAADAKADCNEEYDDDMDGCANIKCNSYKNCDDKYGKYDPRRYTCRAARGACKFAKAIARAVCEVAAKVERTACRLAADAKKLLCNLSEIAKDIGCSAAEVGLTIVYGLKGIFHTAIASVGLGLDAFKAGVLALGGIVAVITGAIVGIGAGLLAGGCVVGRWAVNLGCRGLGWAGRKLCELGTLIPWISCNVGDSLRVAFVGATEVSRGPT